MRSFKSNENIHKKEGGSYYVVSANKASSVTLQSPGNESQRKHTSILRISNRQSSYIFEESEIDDNLNFMLFLKINIEMLNRMAGFKEILFFGYNVA